MQDTLERALSRWHLRRSDGDVRAWLFTILRNLHVSAHRRRSRRGTAVGLDAEPLAAHGTAPDGALEAQDVLAALDHLPEEQKSLLLLIGVEDFSYEEAARMLDLPMGTVMSRLSRARERLRQLMTDGAPARAPLRVVK